MPGPYAHITLVNQLRQARVFESIGLSLSEMRLNSPEFFRFCELGAVSPDYPNLADDDGAGSKWADAMHYRMTGNMIRRGVRYIRGIELDSRCKLLAWLLGYCAHVVTDVTIHPVVLEKVGDYSQNRRQHRLCEMNQDAHVFRRMALGEIPDSDHFTSSVRGCGNPEDIRQMDRDIAAFWDTLLRDVYPDMYATNPPDINAWHSRFVTLGDADAAGDGNLFPLGSLIASYLGTTYPASDKADGQYVENLQVPFGPPMHYGELFNKAAMHVAVFWKQVIGSVYGDEVTFLSRIGEWDLDTGRDENNRLVFWGNDPFEQHSQGAL